MSIKNKLLLVAIVFIMVIGLFIISIPIAFVNSLGGGNNKNIEECLLNKNNASNNYAVCFDTSYDNNEMGNSDYGNGEIDINALEASKGIKSPASGTVTAVAWYYPISFGGGWHPGIDIADSSGTPIKAPADIIILYSGWAGTYGNMSMGVSLVNDKVYSFIFAHMTKTNGTGTFKQGETIGYMGSTGFSTGPHLHFEIFRHNTNNISKEIAYYKKTNDYQYGLTYNTKGNCSNICRLAPHQVLKTSMNKYIK